MGGTPIPPHRSASTFPKLLFSSSSECMNFLISLLLLFMSSHTLDYIIQTEMDVTWSIYCLKKLKLKTCNIRGIFGIKVKVERYVEIFLRFYVYIIKRKVSA